MNSRTLYEEGMVAALPELHHDVEEGGHSSGSRGAFGEEHEVLLEDSSIVLLLNGC